MQQNDWLSNRVTYIQALKKPSEQQELLALLFEKPNRSAEEQKQLDILVKAERAGERAAQARVEEASLINQRKDEARKARTHRLITQGLLLDFSGLDDVDRGAVLGGLLSLREAMADPEKMSVWKRRGDELLAQKEDKA